MTHEKIYVHLVAALPDAPATRLHSGPAGGHGAAHPRPHLAGAV